MVGHLALKGLQQLCNLHNASLLLPSTPSEITMELDTSESLASTGPTIVKTSISDSQDRQGLENPSIPDGRETSDSGHRGWRTFCQEQKEDQKEGKKSLRPNGRARQLLQCLTMGRRQPRQPREEVGQLPRPSAKTLAPHQFPLLWPSLSQPRQRKLCDKKNERLMGELEEAKCLAKGFKEAHFLPVGRRGGDLEAEMRRVLRGGQRIEGRGGGNDEFPHLQVL